jgi:hypothetical protein
MSIQHSKFTTIRSEHIPERNATATLLEHNKTGAKVLKIDNEDNNKVFSVTLRTPVDNDYGIPHILEHSVLAGSKNFKLKEPFADLIKSSLATFINAFTYPDKTVYPVASTNQQDLLNLSRVYLDAVFNPNLTESTLMREGWHYEVDPETDKLIYKGVVYNEMWGSYANPYGEIFDESMSAVFPDTTYNNRSGGNPQVIPELTYDEIRDFHAKYYHPSNSMAILYGNDTSNDLLDLLDEYYSEYDKQEVDSTIHPQPMKDTPQHVTRGIMNYSDEKKGTTLLSHVFSHSSDQDDIFKRHLEAYYLLGTSGSPLYKALMESELGEEVFIGSPDLGNGEFDPLVQNWTLFGLKNVDVDKFDDVHTIIQDVLKETIANVDADNLRSSLNTLEFNLKEDDTGRTPQGLSLIGRILGTWLYDGDPFEALKYSDQINEIKSYLENVDEFKQNIQKYWLDYPHQVRVDLTPDPSMKEEWKTKPVKQLEAKQNSLSPEELDAIKSTQDALIKEQEAPDTEENLATLPVLKISDISNENEVIPKEITSIENSTVLYHNQPTQDLIYLDLFCDMNHIPNRLIPYLPMFTEMLFETGTTQKTHSELQFALGMYTGGVSISPSSHFTLSGQLVIGMNIQIRSLPEYADEAVKLCLEIMYDANISDTKKLKQLLIESKSNYQNALNSNGMGFVIGDLSAELGGDGNVSEQLGGISQYKHILKMIDDVETDPELVVSAFKELQQIAFGGEVTSSITTTQSSRTKGEESLATILKGIQPVDVSQFPVDDRGARNAGDAKAYSTVTQVNFTGMGFKLSPYGYIPHGSMNVINSYLRMGYLWEKVRLIGGAYGNRNMYDNLSDEYYLCSYRDPNIVSTLDTYKAIGQHLQNMDLSQAELDKLKIGTIGSYDSHLLPHQKGGVSLSRHLLGVTDQYRQIKRKEILSTTLLHFKETGTYFEAAAKDPIVRIVGNADQIKEAGQSIEGLNVEELLK